MEITTTIKFKDQVTKIGKKPFRADISCPLCGVQMRLLSFNSGCSHVDGMLFRFCCDMCGTEVTVNTEDKQ